MKLENLRPGMVIEKMKTANAKSKSATPIKEDLYEIIKIENTETNGYTMTAIWLGNLSSNDACMVDITTLNNPSEWKYYDGAFVTEKHQVVKEITFLNRDPLIITTSKTVPVKESELLEEAPVPQIDPSKKTSREWNPLVSKRVVGIKGESFSGDLDIPPAGHNSKQLEQEHTNFQDFKVYRSCTYDDLDYLVESLIYTYDYYKRKIPNPASKSALVHSQELSAFRDGYTIKEVRELGLRIKHTPHSTQEKCSYQTVLRRIIQAMVWYGKPNEKKALKLAKKKNHG